MIYQVNIWGSNQHDASEFDALNTFEVEADTQEEAFELGEKATRGSYSNAHLAVQVGEDIKSI